MSKPQLSTGLAIDERGGMTWDYRIERTWTLAKGPGRAPAWPLSNPSCEQCYDMPPPGFTCNECRAGSATPEPPPSA